MSCTPVSSNDSARDRLVALVLPLARLDKRRFTELQRSTRVRLQGSSIEVQFAYLGETSWYDWDGTQEHLQQVLETAAASIAKTLEFERQRYGPTPWDA